jgi:hypothetical protein
MKQGRPIKRGKGLRRVAKHDKMSLTRLHKKARTVFAHWIVARDKNVCFTCGKWGNQAGHFRHGKNMDFSERGNHCQCVACNLFRSGNLAVYAQRLIEKYGANIIKKLNQEADKVRIFKRKELERIIKKYA